MTLRRYEMSEGSSKKFWTILMEGTSYTVTFGRLGSSGQSRSKSFATEEEARLSAEKLIAEKMRKGYAETGITIGAPPPPPDAAQATRMSPPAPAVRLEPEDLFRVTYLEHEPLTWDSPSRGVVQDRLRDTAPEELVRRILQFNGKPVEQSMEWLDFHHSSSLALDFRQYVVPRLRAGEKETLRELVRTLGATKTRRWSDGTPQWSHPAFMIAAALGMHEETLRLVESWRDDYFAGPARPRPFHYELLFGLPSCDLVVRHAKRLRMPMADVSAIRGWLAHTGAEELDYVAEGIAALKNKSEAEKAARELARAEAPQTAHAMLILYARSKAQTVARKWMDEHADWTGEALRTEVTNDGPLKKEAAHLLGAYAPPTPIVAEQKKTLSAPVPPPTPMPAPTPDAPVVTINAPMEETPRIRLEPADVYRVTYRAPAPLPLPEISRPFDLERCLSELKAGAEKTSNYYHSWAGLKLPERMSPEEAHFWFSAMTTIYSRDVNQLVQRLRKKEYGLPVSVEQVQKDLGSHGHLQNPFMLKILRDLLPLSELVEFLGNTGSIRMNSQSSMQAYHFHWFLVTGFHSSITPYLSSEHRERLAALLREWVTSSLDQWPLDETWLIPAPRFFYAAAIGMHEEVLALVRSWPDDTYVERLKGKIEDVSGGRHPQNIVFGLGSRELVVGEMKRLSLRLSDPEYIRAWLAHTGTDELDYVAESIASAGSKALAAKLTAELARVEGPAAAPAMLRVYTDSKAQPNARSWFEKHPEWTAAGLSPIANGRGKPGDEARRILLLTHKGKAESIREAAVGETSPVPRSPAAPKHASPVGPIPVPGYALPEGMARTVHLEPEDLRWVTSRPFEPLPRPPQSTLPFDPEPAIANMEKKTWPPDWKTWKFDSAMSPQEGYFWLTVILLDHNIFWGGKVRLTLSKVNLPEIPVPAQTVALINRSTSLSDGEMLVPALHAMYGLDGVLDVLLFPGKEPIRMGHGLVTGFRRYLLPTLTQEERRMMAGRLRPLHDPTQWPKDSTRVGPLFHLAAMIGMYTETRALVESWKDGRYATDEQRTNDYWYHFPEEIVLGLSSEEEVTRQMRRLGIVILRACHLRGFLAHTEWRALDLADRTLQKATAISYGGLNSQLEETLSTVGRVEAPETGELMFRMSSDRRAGRVARTWIEKHPLHTAAGVIPQAVGDGNGARDALAFLRGMKSRGHGDAIAVAARAYGTAIAERIAEEVLRDYAAEAAACAPGTLPPWLVQEMARQKPARLPSWLIFSQLPPLRVGETDLSAEQVNALLAALESSALDTPLRLVEMIRQAADARSRDAFAWKIVSDWLHDGAPPKDKWALTAVGLLGGDESALSLAPLIRAWPGEGQHQRAVLGLDCLRAIGTDVALMQIHGIAQRVKFQALKKRAGECMEAVALSLALSRDQLEDRIVPDCGLEDGGIRTFDFGPRQFHLLLRSDLKPYLRYPDGSLKTDLPKPTTKDDAEKTEAAIAEWKTIRKVVAEAAKTQSRRLEQAMITSRAWSVSEFESLLVRHPLVGVLVRHFIWGAFDNEGNLQQTFRVTEDGTYADVEDNQISPSTAFSVRLVHPLDLPDPVKSAWGHLLAEYEIMPSFAQLGREIHELEEGERMGREIVKFAGKKYPARSLIRSLDSLGWTRTVDSDGGSFSFHCKPFGGCGVTALINYEPGACIDMLDDEEDQEITSLCFYPGAFTAQESSWNQEPLPLTEISPVVISETFRDLYAATSKK